MPCEEGDSHLQYAGFDNGGWIAQSVEQRTENPCVGGSIPSPATTPIKFNGINGFAPFEAARKVADLLDGSVDGVLKLFVKARGLILNFGEVSNLSPQCDAELMRRIAWEANLLRIVYFECDHVLFL
jgi:hypothetical protein